MILLNPEDKYSEDILSIFFKPNDSNSFIQTRDFLSKKSFVDLTFETVHPDNKENFFTYSFCNGENSLNATITSADAPSILQTGTLHSHDYFELMYVIKGNVYQNIENQKHFYPEGSLCLMNRNIRHKEEYTTDYRAAFIALSPALIENLISTSKHFIFDCEYSDNLQKLLIFFSSNIDKDVKAKKEYIDFIPLDNSLALKKMYSCFEAITRSLTTGNVGATYHIMENILKILDMLSKENYYTTVPVSIGTQKENSLFKEINLYLRENKGRVSRQELSDHFSYNGTYLNRVVKKYTGLSIINYGFTIALKEAARLLIETDMKIYEICDDLSFANHTHFFNLFKDTYGMTPTEYRNLHKLQCTN